MGIIYLVRHGEAQPVGSYCVGSGTDLPLTPEGRAQGEALGRCFREFPPGERLHQPLDSLPGDRPAAGGLRRGAPSGPGPEGALHGLLGGPPL